MGCGGLIPLLLAAGNQVQVTYVTDGGGSAPGYPNLAELRRAEALAATGLLGLSSGQLEFLGARDGTLARLDEVGAAALTAQLVATLARLRPTLVLLPCRADGSSEHDATFTLFHRALSLTTFHPRVFEFPVWSWWNPLLLRRPLKQSRRVWRATFPEHAVLKQRALATQVTQVQPLQPGRGPMLTPEFLAFFNRAEEFFFEA